MRIIAPICEPLKLKNCAEFEDAHHCLKCNPEHILTEMKDCLPYPQEKINNCEVYSSDSTCSKCSTGFYLKLTHYCEQIKSIDNCTIYDNTAKTEICLECNDKHYLKDNICEAREKSLPTAVENCESVDVESDVCTKCIPNFVISSDGLKCFEAFDQCLNHKNVSSSSDATLCTECNPGFYLKEGVCTQGTDENCHEFRSESDLCEICKNGFYLVGDEPCKPHIEIENCETFSSVELNTCNACMGGFFNFVIEKVCVELNSILDCIEYDNGELDTESTCNKCAKRFYLTENACEEIPIENCDELEGDSTDVCVLCKEGFYLFSYNDGREKTECIKAHEYLGEHCE